MHYYSFNIGDYASHTSHLDPLEDIAYRRMIDWCYLHEEPLPEDVNQIARLIRMREHCTCIANVLQEFFILGKGGYSNERIVSELKSYQDVSKKRKKAANTRWASKHKGLNGDASALQVESKSNAKQEPRTKNQEPLNKSKKEILIPVGINESAWSEWVEYRKGKKKNVSQAAATKQFKLLSDYSEPDQQLIINQSISNDYQGLFPLKGNSNGQYQQPNQPKPSLIDRVKAGAEQRERERAARAGREFNGQGMDQANGDVRPQVHQSVRGDGGRYVGNLLEGDYTETSS